MEQYRDEVSQTGVDLNQVRVAYQEGEVGILELLDSYRVTRQALLRLVDLEALAKESQIDLDRARVDPMVTLRNLTTVERRSGRLTPSSPAAESAARRHDERSCRRSGAAPCWAAVGALQLNA